MYFHLRKLLSFCIVGLAVTSAVFAQGGPSVKSTNKNQSPTPRALYEEAEHYVERKFQEFNKQKLAFDPKLEAKTKEEQKALATANATTLQSSPNLSGDDFYYLGMLNHLAADSDKAYEAMKRFLAGPVTGEKAQVARAVFIVHAIKKNDIAAAEETVSVYAKNEPLNAQELFGMETLLTNAYFKANDFVRTLEHAQTMMAIGKASWETKQVNNWKRDEMLAKASSFIVEAHVKMNRKDLAIEALQELGRAAVLYPSGNLYKTAKIRLFNLDPNADVWKLVEAEPDKLVSPPELLSTEWIDHESQKLPQFKGKVVILDFWAPWCGPCRFTLPQLQKWHDAYKDEGLVILGLTNYNGRAEGKVMTPAEELVYLRDFKKKNRLSYPFVIADTSQNDKNYGVVSIPISFLVDRNGKLRFISAGASEQELKALGEMIKKLLAEEAK